MKYKIGDKVEVPLKEGMPYGFVTESEGIPKEFIMHGNLIRKEGVKQIGEIVNIYNSYYIVKLKAVRSKDNSGYVRVGFAEGQLILQKPKPIGTEENYLFSIDDL